MLVDVAWLLILVATGVTAGVLETQFGRWNIPRARLWSWLMWTAVCGSAISFVVQQKHTGLDAALLWGLLVGPLCQPAFHTLLWLGAQPGVRRELNRSRAGRAYLRIGFWTVDLDDRPEPPRRPLRPEAPKPPGPAWPAPLAKGVAALAVVTWPALAFGTDRAQEPGHVAAVRASLDRHSYEDAQVRRVMTGGACWSGQEYAWRAAGGDGHACVRDGLYVTVRVDQENWTRDPFSRPAK